MDAPWIVAKVARSLGIQANEIHPMTCLMVKNLNPIKGTIIPVTKGNIIPYDPKNQGESISGKTYKTRGKIPTMNEPMSYLLLKIQ